MPKRAFDSNGGIPPWVTAEPTTFPAREGVLWQPCPYCKAEPGQACMNLTTGTTASDFHRSRPDGYSED